MIISFDDQTNSGDGIIVEDDNLPNVLGWGETQTEALSDLLQQTHAIMEAVVEGIERLNQMGFNRREET